MFDLISPETMSGLCSAKETRPEWLISPFLTLSSPKIDKSKDDLPEPTLPTMATLSL